MTTNRPSRFHFLATLGFAALLGCTTPSLPPWKTGSVTTTSDSEPTVSKRSEEELPPNEAAHACMVTAESLQDSGHVEQAIFLFEKARRNDPNLKTVAHHLAVLYDIQGDSTKSLAEYKKAVEAEPKNPDVFSDLGYYYFNRGNFSDAEHQLRKAIELDSKHLKALTNLGMVLASEKRFDESFAMFSRASGPAAAHSNVGVFMAKQGLNDEARKQFHEALALDSSLKQPRAFLEYLDRPR
jgi:Tfp pilus assembly protein PilF